MNQNDHWINKLWDAPPSWFRGAVNFCVSARPAFHRAVSFKGSPPSPPFPQDRKKGFCKASFRSIFSLVVPEGIRRVSAVRGRCPRPLDDGTIPNHGLAGDMFFQEALFSCLPSSRLTALLVFLCLQVNRPYLIYFDLYKLFPSNTNLLKSWQGPHDFHQPHFSQEKQKAVPEE